jgi:beta-glucosidase
LIIFPHDFRWGAGISAHQAEGGDFASDWWRWEQRPGRILGGGTSEHAAGHYIRWRGDLDLAAKLGINALVYALSWPRICPAPDRFDEEALAHYSEVFQYAHEKGITLFAVLMHGSAPAWFSGAGPWLRKNAADAFRVYAEKVVAHLAPWCRHWIPVFEPLFHVEMAVRQGCWPGWTWRWQGAPWLTTGIMLMCMISEAEKTIRAAGGNMQAGASLRADSLQPENPYSPWDLRAAAPGLMDRFFYIYRDHTEKADFLLLSWQGRATVRFDPFLPRRGFRRWLPEDSPLPGPERTIPDAGAMAGALNAYRNTEKPVYLAVHGPATEDDAARCRFLREHIAAAHGCLERGVPLQGYFHLPLLDGFEWTAGYTQRRGIVHVNRGSMARTPNRSAFMLRDIAAANALRPATAAKYCPEEAEKEQSNGSDTRD